MTAPGSPAAAARPPVAWLFDLARLQDRLEAAEVRHGRLSADEQARAAAMRDPQRRQRWVASRIATRLALEAWAGSRLAGRPFDIAPGGRPYLPPPWPAFSLSHAADLVLAAVAGAGPIGVDLEPVAPRQIPSVRREQIENFAHIIAATDVAATLAHADADRRFIQAWCRIEACAKADGRGVARLLAEAGILGPGSRQRRAALAVGGAVDPESFSGHGGAMARPYAAYDLDVSAMAPGFAAAVAGPARAGLGGLAVADGALLLDSPT